MPKSIYMVAILLVKLRKAKGHQQKTKSNGPLKLLAVEAGQGVNCRSFVEGRRRSSSHPGVGEIFWRGCAGDWLVQSSP